MEKSPEASGSHGSERMALHVPGKMHRSIHLAGLGIIYEGSPGTATARIWSLNLKAGGLRQTSMRVQDYKSLGLDHRGPETWAETCQLNCDSRQALRSQEFCSSVMFLDIQGASLDGQSPAGKGDVHGQALLDDQLILEARRTENEDENGQSHDTDITTLVMITIMIMILMTLGCDFDSEVFCQTAMTNRFVMALSMTLSATV